MKCWTQTLLDQTSTNSKSQYYIAAALDLEVLAYVHKLREEWTTKDRKSNNLNNIF